MTIPGCEEFSLAGSRVGFLLCHGFTASPRCLRPWAAALAAEGYSVEAPLLAGHGDSWKDVNTTTWPQWYASLEAAYTRLAARCDVVFAIGHSMGGALTIRLAAAHPEIRGVILVNPSVTADRRILKTVPTLSRAIPSLPGVRSDVKKPGEEQPGRHLPLRALTSLMELWPLARTDLPLVTSPVLLALSRYDRVVLPASAEIVRTLLPTPPTELLLPNSSHLAPLDYDAPFLFTESLRFAESLLSSSPYTPATCPAQELPDAREALSLYTISLWEKRLQERYTALVSTLSSSPLLVEARSLPDLATSLRSELFATISRLRTRPSLPSSLRTALARHAAHTEVIPSPLLSPLSSLSSTSLLPSPHAE